MGLQQAQAPKQVAAPTSPALAPNSAPGQLLQQAKAAVLRMLSTVCEDVAGLAVAYQSSTLTVEQLQQLVSLVAGAKIGRSLQQLRDLHKPGLDIEAELDHLEQLLLVAAQQHQPPLQQHAGSKRHAVALPAQQRQKRRRAVADSESGVDEDSGCAADGEYGWLFSLNPSPHPPHRHIPPCLWLWPAKRGRGQGMRGQNQKSETKHHHHACLCPGCFWSQE